MPYTPLFVSLSASGAWSSDAFTLAPIPQMGTGAVATRPLPAGTPLFHLPLAYLLTPWTSALGPALAADGGADAWAALAEKGWAQLMLAMMYEESLGDRSRWAGYLATMPREFGAPMWWDEGEVQGLRGTDIEDRIGKDSAHELYTTTLAPLMAAHPALFPPSSEHFTLHAFHVQGSRILSRSFTVPRTRAGGPAPGVDEDGDEEEEEDVAVMVPMADMLNAAYERDNARLFADGVDEDGDGEAEGEGQFGEGYTMITTKDIAEGEQIYNTYASPPNSELLRKYGHVDDLPLPQAILDLLSPEEVGSHPLGNAGDDVEVPGDLVVAAAAAAARVDPATLAERVEWWLEEGQEDAFSLSFPDPEEDEDAIPPALVAFARLLSSDAEWARAKGKGKLPRPSLDAASAGIIGAAIGARRARHTTSLQDDLGVVAGPPGRARDAAVVRLGEKRVMGVCVRFIGEAQESLRKKEAEEAKAARAAARSAKRKERDEDGGRGKRRR